MKKSLNNNDTNVQTLCVKTCWTTEKKNYQRIAL